MSIDRHHSALTEALATALSAALAELPAGATAKGVTIALDVPPTPELGDFSTDLALQVARASRQAPAAVARALAERLVPAEGSPLAAILDRVDVTPSGVLNFRLRADWREAALRDACVAGDAYGRQESRGESLLVEFVSANPTGPLHVAHGRGAVLGDSLCRILEAVGFTVTREFYVNDLSARADETGSEGVDQILGQQKATLGRLGVQIDEWRKESVLQAAGRTEEALSLIREAGHTYTSDGAEWLRTTAFGDVSDHVLRRGNGQLTYLAGDLGYHLDKLRRGFSRVIDIWGAEHAHYVERTQAGMMALGEEPEKVEIVIFQPVHVRIDGMLVEGGSASGNNVPLDEVLEKVGAERARWLYLSRPAGVPLELDLDQGRLEGVENPAVRVQLALRKSTEAVSPNAVYSEASLADCSPEATALANLLVRFPDEVQSAAQEREPAHLARYALAVADAYLALADDASNSQASPSSQALLSHGTAVVLRNAHLFLGIPPQP